MSPVDVLVVAGEPVWPASHGGRLRTAGLVGALARHLAVGVAAPPDGEPPIDVDVAFDSLPAERPLGRLSAGLHPSPRLGRALLGPERIRRLSEIGARQRPRTLLFARSYLAAVAPDLGIPVAVDFADVEVRRTHSLARSGCAPPRARVAFALEWLKARRWEPAVARRSLVGAATSWADVSLVSSWGARAVLVPNGAAPRTIASRSPARGPVTFVANFGYGPNRDGARFLLERVWPRLQRAAPARLRLCVVGRHAAGALSTWAGIPGVDVVTDPDDVEPFYREASLVVAPVRTGGGSQLKVTEALARGRLVVATPFSARAAPPGAEAGVEAAAGAEQFAAAILGLWSDTATRWAREQALVARGPVPTWDEACRPLVDALLLHLAHA